MSIARSATIALAAGLTAASILTGCAAKPGTVEITDETPTLAAKTPIAPALSPDAESQRQSVVIDTVGDTVDRYDRIIRQREQAKQFAADVRETRAANPDVAQAKTGTKTETKTSAPESEASAVEKLATALRERKAIDVLPETPAPTPAAANSSVATTDAPKQAIPTANVHEAPAAGSIDSGTGIQVRQNGEDVSPNISRSSLVDPMLSVEQKLADRVAKDPRDISASLDLQLAHFLKGDAVPSASDLAALPAEDRELLSAVCDALGNFRSVVRDDPNPLNSIKARPFIEMADRIRSRADLTVSGLTLCTKVSTFGVYDKIEPLAFSANQPNKLVVYCEVDGFLSSQAGDSWQTKLSLEIKLYDERGLAVWAAPVEETVDTSNRRRRDFFLAKIIDIPALPAGRYMMKATVRDPQANRVDQKTIQFQLNPKDQSR